MVTSTVWMLYWILSHTPNLWPAVALDSILVVCISSLKERFISTSTSGNNTDLCTTSGGYSFLSSGWETKTCGSLIFIVGYNNSEASRSTSERTTISSSCLTVTYDGTLWYSTQRKNVSNGKGSLLSTVDELTSVHTLGSNHEFIVTLVTVGIEELYLGNWGTTTRVMDDLLDDSLDVSVFLGVVNGAEFDSSLTGASVGFEDGGFTLPLRL